MLSFQVLNSCLWDELHIEIMVEFLAAAIIVNIHLRISNE